MQPLIEVNKFVNMCRAGNFCESKNGMNTFYIVTSGLGLHVDSALQRCEMMDKGMHRR